MFMLPWPGFLGQAVKTVMPLVLGFMRNLWLSQTLGMMPSFYMHEFLDVLVI